MGSSLWCTVDISFNTMQKVLERGYTQFDASFDERKEGKIIVVYLL